MTSEAKEASAEAMKVALEVLSECIIYREHVSPTHDPPTPGGSKP